jgi:predicted RNase H-like nuclease (RuvC/YqgF family)
MSEQAKVSNVDVLDRLVRLRAVLPLMATDLATARRRASTLEAENERLGRRVRELEDRLAEARWSVREPAPRRRRVTHQATHSDSA